MEGALSPHLGGTASKPGARKLGCLPAGTRTTRPSSRKKRHVPSLYCRRPRLLPGVLPPLYSRRKAEGKRTRFGPGPIGRHGPVADSFQLCNGGGRELAEVAGT